MVGCLPISLNNFRLERIVSAVNLKGIPMCLLFQVESGDLIAYGLIPEFIGRFPILVSLAALNEDQLVQVISVCYFNAYLSVIVCVYVFILVLENL